MLIPSPHQIFAHTSYPVLDGLCVKKYLCMVSEVYCVSVRDNIDFVCPKKTRVKRAQAGTLARGYRFIAQPTAEQEKLINRILGASRWVWNWGLNLYLQHETSQNEKEKNKTVQKSGQARKSKHTSLSYNEVSNQLTQLKKTFQTKMRNGVLVHEKHWLNTIPDTVLRQSLMDLGNTWKAYEDGKNGKRRDTPGKPKFKSKTHQNDSATFQVDARVECKSSCIDSTNNTIKIPGIEQPHNVLTFKRTENILGEISSFVIAHKTGQYYISLSMINIAHRDIIASKVHGKHNLGSAEENNLASKFVDFAYDEYPLCSTLNPKREGLLAIDMAAKWGGVATRDGKTTYQLISEEQREKATQKEHNTIRFQRVQSRKIEAKYQEYGITREANGAWPKDAGKLLAEKVAERNEKHKRKRTQKILKNKTLNNTEKQQQIADLTNVFFAKSQRQIVVEQRLSQTHTLKRNFLVDAIHKATTHIIEQNHTVVCETLNVKAMLEDESKHSGFKKSIANTCMSEITRQLKYKARWYGRNIIFVSPWFASSQLCSTKGCTYQHTQLKLSDTHWTCPMCKKRHERNSNASFNLWFQGWHLLEEFFEQNSTKNLADGSFVKGSQGVVEKTVSIEEHRAWQKATSKKSRRQNVSPTVARFQKAV